MFLRSLKIKQLVENKSLLLLGPRQTGKSTLIRSAVPDALFIDLLEADTFRQLVTYPERIREWIGLKKYRVVVIDEVQKIPVLLDEVHRLIELDKSLRFILTGSSARKLKKVGVNILGGRARRVELNPITTQEFKTTSLGLPMLPTLLQWGGLPSILTSKTPKEDLKDYVGTYLLEEIQAESWVRSLENFSRFLDSSALVNTEQLNYAAVASDAGIPSKTVQEYFQLLEDTLIGKLLPPFRKTKSRKAMVSPKFYLFDVGVSNAILGRWSLGLKTPEYGKAFEHLVWREISSYISYCNADLSLSYWRAENKFEVDFILQMDGQKEPICAIEAKAKDRISEKDCIGLEAFSEDFPAIRKIIVSLETKGRKLENGIEVWPAEEFFSALWGGNLIL